MMSKCPVCGGQIFYNGNYYCADIEYGGPCDWRHSCFPNPDYDEEEEKALLAAYNSGLIKKGTS